MVDVSEVGEDGERHCCGCCGQVEVDDDLWCWPCSTHVMSGHPTWESTWFAQHGEPCPFALAMEGAP